MINNFQLLNKNILFVSPEITWNQHCGNTIWASCFLSLLIKKYKCKINAIECIRYNENKNNNLYENIHENVKFTNLLKNNNFFITGRNCAIVNFNVLIKYIIKNINNYDFIIIRSIELMQTLNLFLINILNNNIELKNKILQKIIYIVVDRNEEKKFISNLHNVFHMTYIAYFNDKKRLPHVPHYIIPPLLTDESIYKTNFSINNDIKYDFCIVGTLAERSYLEQILPIFTNINYSLIIAGKIQHHWVDTFKSLFKKYETNKNIHFYCKEQGISKDESNKIILQSKFGIRIDKPVECLSSKVLNYICYNRIPVVQRIKTHELLLTKDYPFFVSIDPMDTSKDFLNILSTINEDKIKLAKELVIKAKEKLDVENLLKNNFSIDF